MPFYKPVPSNINHFINKHDKSPRAFHVRIEKTQTPQYASAITSRMRKMLQRSGHTEKAQREYAKKKNQGQAPLLTVPLLSGLLEPPMSILAISLLKAEAP